MRAIPFLLLLACCGGSSTPPSTAPTSPTVGAVPTTSAPVPAASTAAASSPDVATDAKMRDDARQRLIMIARDVVAAWEREHLSPDGKTAHQELCPATKPTPATLDRGKAVSTKDDDWMKDAGWSCLRFLPSEPLWFQFEVVKADDHTVQVFARRHDLELELDVTRKSGGEWKIAPEPVEHKR